MAKTRFTINRPEKKLGVDRVFNAPLPLVWKAWTSSNLLDQWWAPKPWKAKTRFLDFREGGSWLYCMHGPDGEQHWSRADFENILPHERFSATDYFIDAEGNRLLDMPDMHWTVLFLQEPSGTHVQVQISFPSLKDMDTIVAMGFKEGFASAHDNLDNVLSQQPSNTYGND